MWDFSQVASSSIHICNIKNKKEVREYVILLKKREELYGIHSTFSHLSLYLYSHYFENRRAFFLVVLLTPKNVSL